MAEVTSIFAALRKTHHLLLCLLAFRLVNAVCTYQTFFQPDEYFQALEPAWNLAFGPSSGAWLTWEWRYHLRSSLHPVLFAFVYAVTDRLLVLLSWLPINAASILAFAPQVAQAGLAASADYFTWSLAGKIFGPGSISASCGLWMSLLSPWHWYCSTRTFSNSLEMTLTIAALSCWPWSLVQDSKRRLTSPLGHPGAILRLRLCLFLAATAVLLRPTNVVIWLAVAGWTIRNQPSTLSAECLILFREAVLCGGAALGLSAISDRYYFQQWTFPPYYWFNFNLNQDLAVFYGSMDWHYYLSQGITQLTMTFLPFAVIGLYQGIYLSNRTLASHRQVLQTLSIAVLSMIATLAIVAHKEVRFIYPLLPIIHVVAAPSFAAFFLRITSTQAVVCKRTPILGALVVTNVIIAAYLSLFHARAPISVMHFVRHEYERIHPTSLDLHPHNLPSNYHYHTQSVALDTATSTGSTLESSASDGSELFALFLTPCHTTPWRSHLIYPSLRARALTCEPPLHTAPRSVERANYKDETSRFFATPSGQVCGSIEFLSKEIWPLPLPLGEVGDQSSAKGGRSETPRYIVGFEHIEPTLLAFFGVDGNGREMGVTLKKVWRRWNGLFSDDDRKTGYLAVWDTGVYSDQ